MTHVELSLSQAFVPQSRVPGEVADPTALEPMSNVDRWAMTVASAVEPCLVINRAAVIVAVSAACCELLGLDEPAHAVGRPLIGETLRLIDFTAVRGTLSDIDIEKIPPLLAMSSERPARGLMRVLSAGGPGDVTVDAIATPLSDAGTVQGTLTFFARV